ncbi:hypothetical protein [Paraferrimonas sedimenticola]|uniref:Uncharacterized protein n=1 Tax=Paraferrimonas sedimenticola TaxID=375674 RepID=A0AA37RS07_9GAMM|nr:hypothetical protein [Paraferrimonas sedimenticola]GLP95330.1 hypothetical protein GCM10007895_06360 [Paraferrimonas sedimenticola]
MTEYAHELLDYVMAFNRVSQAEAEKYLDDNTDGLWRLRTEPLPMDGVIYEQD